MGPGPESSGGSEQLSLELRKLIEINDSLADHMPLLGNSLLCTGIFQMDGSVRELFLFSLQGHFESYLYIWILSYRRESQFYSQAKQSELENKMRNTSFLISYFPFLQSPYFSCAESSFI